MHDMSIETYFIALIFLAFVLILITSLISLNLTRKIAATTAWQQKLWIACSALSLGVGIWSMHFIAFLAHPLSLSITYDVQAVVTSLAIAIVGALVGFFVMYRSKLEIPRLFFGGTFMGFCFASMHYIGLGAVTNVVIHFKLVPFVISIVISVGASMLALYLSYLQSPKIIMNGLLMSLMFICMHFVGILAADIHFPAKNINFPADSVSMDNFLLAMFVAFGTVILLFINLSSSLKTDQKLQNQFTLRASILSSSLDCIMMFNSRGWIIEFNPAAEATFGYSRKYALSLTLLDFLFPFDQSGQAAASLFGQLVRQDDAIMGKRLEMLAYRADRSEFPVEITITGFHHEGKPIFTAFLRDLSKTKTLQWPSEQIVS
ncbi:PAS domain S-box protein [Paenibacillus alba]|uniref:MHYT domain-containing protein n=1 Tax=Paenibacillus alba TaxID=1197127 RepID=UPI001563749B|nr:MHYT domain-containing protein [Paenibacillus alba]NQX65079.1 PAS domain S-box protein [Paenibacillus alba]